MVCSPCVQQLGGGTPYPFPPAPELSEPRGFRPGATQCTVSRSHPPGTCDGLEAGELVVDVGAGTGVLTLAAAAVGARVVAVERRQVWCERLRERVRKAGLGEHVRVFCGDLRNLAPPEGRWQVIASPPFGLTTALLRRLLDDPRRGPCGADLVLQWEVTRKFSAATTYLTSLVRLRRHGHVPGAWGRRECSASSSSALGHGAHCHRSGSQLAGTTTSSRTGHQSRRRAISA
ncbi:MAG: rRNA adenine N-6-methyltransferase family protein [Egibacteraceae bacterium]